MNQKRIVIDGKTYNSVDEMPEDVRRTYEEAMRGVGESVPPSMPGPVSDLQNIFADKNNNGIPDLLEGIQSLNLGGTKFVVDGRTYNTLDQLPPEARARYEQAMGSIDANRNGMPDFLEGVMKVSPPPASAQPTFEYPADTARHASPPPQAVSPTFTPDTSNGWMLGLAILALLFLCAVGAAGGWYFFLR